MIKHLFNVSTLCSLVTFLVVNIGAVSAQSSGYPAVGNSYSKEFPGGYTLASANGTSQSAFSLLNTTNSGQVYSNVYRLTTEGANQSNALWANTAVDLTQDFTIEMQEYLGQNGNTGADGLQFALLPGTKTPSSSLINPNMNGSFFFKNSATMGSIGILIETDVYKNETDNINDPDNHHIAIFKDLMPLHSPDYLLAVTSTTNSISNATWHTVTYSYKFDTKTLSVNLDGFVASANIDLAAYLGTTTATWGIGAGTGGYTNLFAISFPTPEQTLPVNITGFAGASTSDGVTLSWNTLTEQNNNLFQVQQSVDGKNWTVIGTVNSLAIQGNSNTTLNYAFTDKNAHDGKNYYRIAQIDLNGKISVSSPITVNYSSKVSIAIYPNPATSFVNIKSKEIIKVVTVYNVAGQQLLSRYYNATDVRVSLGNLSKGIYILKITKQDNTVINEKILVK